MKYMKAVFAILCVFFLLASVYCTNLPDTTIASDSGDSPVTVNQPDDVPGNVRLQSYSGSRPAIIFVVDHTGKGINENVTESIIRQFAENKDTLSLAVLPFMGVEDTCDIKSLQYYVEAGIVDINVNYDRMCLANSEASCPGMSYEELKIKLSEIRGDFQRYYGEEPVTCVLGEGLFCEDTYNVLQATGFKIVTASMQEDELRPVQFTGFSGEPDVNGLVRLPFTGNVCAIDKSTGSWGVVYDTQPDNELFSSVISSINERRVAIIDISPEAFLTVDNEVDAGKLEKLAELIKYIKELGEITTYNSWYTYMKQYEYSAPFHRAMETPEYNGKAAIIFRLDDVAKGWYEETTEEIIKLFQNNNVPVELGIIPYLDGKPSFDIPMVRGYLNNGVADVSMHGFDWTYAQIDTSQSGLTYSELLDKILNGKRQIENYYGSDIVTFTVPNDFFDEAGFNAVKDAGFKIFGTQQIVEPHPSIIPIDYNGIPDPNGMDRIPTASDVTMWDTDKQNWGSVFDVSKLSDLKYYTETPGFYFPREIPEDLPFYNDLYYEVDFEMDKIGIAVLGIHPDAFIDSNGKPDKTKLEKLDRIIKWAKNFASVTTFDQWYKYTESKLESE
jgi:peptidoglycan/xylan/chitin deacetylase (PgdA/CDA1 family)